MRYKKDKQKQKEVTKWKQGYVVFLMM
jgi:hypothetical protein